jgi:hypothetical protein
MPQVRNIINEKGKINLQFIGKFENLEEDFCTILKNIGIKNIIHDNEKKMNVRPHEEFVNYYESQEILDFINNLFKEDFEHLDYIKCNTLDDFNGIYKKIDG